MLSVELRAVCCEAVTLSEIPGSSFRRVLATTFPCMASILVSQVLGQRRCPRSDNKGVAAVVCCCSNDWS